MFKILCYLLLALVRTLQATYRYRYFDLGNRRSAESYHSKNVMIMATWHNNCFAGILSHIYQGFIPLMSQSRDGDLVAFVCEHMGIKTVRGSSSHGGRDARTAIVANFAKGHSSAITVDGPRGPLHEVKFGIIDIAKNGRVAILPVCAVPDRYWQVKSWDKFRIPKPFSRITVTYGMPIIVPHESDKDSYVDFAQTVRTRLMALEESARVNLGQWSLGVTSSS